MEGLESLSLIITVVVGGTVILFLWIQKSLGKSKPESAEATEEVSDDSGGSGDKEKTSSTDAASHAQKSKKKGHWGNRDSRTFSHPWMAAPLKGHTDQVLDMAFSPNGKTLASCADGWTSTCEEETHALRPRVPQSGSLKSRQAKQKQRDCRERPNLLSIGDGGSPLNTFSREVLPASILQRWYRCGGHRSVQLWSVKELTSRDHKAIRINVPFDSGQFISWSPDTKAFLIQRKLENSIQVFKVSKRQDGRLGDAVASDPFPKKHIEDCVGMGIAASGRYIMSCSKVNDLVLWDLKGSILAEIDTRQGDTSAAILSSCGNFIATCGFTPDVKVWHVVFSRSGDFEKVTRAFDLTGHSSRVFYAAFSVDSGKMASVSKDGTWKLFDTAIEFEKGQMARCLQTVAFRPHLPKQGELSDKSSLRIALSPDARTVALGWETSLLLYSAGSGTLEGVIENVHTEPITRVLFEPGSEFVLSAGDKVIRVFHNVVGYKATIQELQDKRKRPNLTSAMKERLDSQIREMKAKLSSLGEN
ncbi:unnamed protein product [Cyprideis torosa]|uniref:Uncharacterized protein n=1 Tax=Cyprideis torosa TaxID=163714 RepID=A0A7R8ZNM7_9CRUS|nr:unnamed protein product [Cyprideis torosa]CAG0896704.1 unnamed protein product [Cyprideis torosa]